MTRQEAFLPGLGRSLVRGAVVGILVGVSVGAVVSAFVVSVYAIFLFYYAAPSAALLGALQGLWLYLERDRWASQREVLLFGTVSGAALGLLGFAPIFVQTNVLLRGRDIVLLLCAAIAGGGAAGRVNASFFVSYARPQMSPGLRRRLVAGGLIVLSIGLFEYLQYGPAVARKLPVPALSERAVRNLPSGHARGVRWAGCYEYNGDFFEGSGVVGTAGGAMVFVQKGGALQIDDIGHGKTLRGGIDADGRFWAGTQGEERDGSALRLLVRGRFLDRDRFKFSFRVSLVKHGSVANTTREDGAGHRVSC